MEWTKLRDIIRQSGFMRKTDDITCYGGLVKAASEVIERMKEELIEREAVEKRQC